MEQSSKIRVKKANNLLIYYIGLLLDNLCNTFRVIDTKSKSLDIAIALTYKYSLNNFKVVLFCFKLFEEIVDLLDPSLTLNDAETDDRSSEVSITFYHDVPTKCFRAIVCIKS